MRMIDDVVAVGAARPRLEIGRGVKIADPEPRQVGRKFGGAVEAKILVELQAIGGAWNDGRHFSAFLPGVGRWSGLPAMIRGVDKYLHYYIPRFYETKPISIRC